MFHFRPDTFWRENSSLTRGELAAPCEAWEDVKYYIPRDRVTRHVVIRDDTDESLAEEKHKVTCRESSGGLFNFGPSRGGLNREGGLLEKGGLFTKSSEKDVFGSFSVPLFHILRIQHTIFRLKYTNSTQFLSQIILKLTCKVV